MPRHLEDVDQELAKRLRLESPKDVSEQQKVYDIWDDRVSRLREFELIKCSKAKDVAYLFLLLASKDSFMDIIGRLKAGKLGNKWVCLAGLATAGLRSLQKVEGEAQCSECRVQQCEQCVQATYDAELSKLQVRSVAGQVAQPVFRSLGK